MDRIIRAYPAREDSDLVFCTNVSIAYQKDMSETVAYDKEYYENYVHREGTTIAVALNKARVNIVEKYCQGLDTLDIGIGSGEFIRSSKNKVYGFDINPYGVVWLKDRYLYINPWENIPANIKGVTLWDTLEHMKSPTEFLDLIPSGVYVFVSMPMVDDLSKLRESKHYKPNEHYYYFTPVGFEYYAKDAGFAVLEHNDQETKAGRDSVHTFALLKL